jgi:hypothetical protein
LAESISVSVDDFVAFAPNQLSKEDLKAFLEGIQVSTSNIHSLSTALIASDAVGDFIRFPKLPVELRFKIWESCLPSQRIVEFYAKVVNDTDGNQMERNIGINQAPHIFFRVCRESRQVAMERYSVQLSKSKYQLANTRIDPKTDWLCLATNSILHMSYLKQIWSPEAGQLKTIGIAHFKWNAKLLGHLFKTFKGADELILLHPVCYHYLKGPIEQGFTKEEAAGRQEQVAVDKFWASRAGRPYAGRKKPAVFYCQYVHARMVPLQNFIPGLG